MSKHVVLTNGRSGSNLLVNYINQHPKLLNYGEALGGYMPSWKLRERVGYGGHSVHDYLDFILSSRRHFWLAQSYAATKRAANRRPLALKHWNQLHSVGIKDFSIRFAERSADRYLTHRPDIKVIALHRPNTFRRALSLLVMEQSGLAAQRPGEKRAKVQMHVDTSRLLDTLATLDTENAQCNTMLAELHPERVCRVRYDDLVGSPSTTMAHIFNFLAVEPVTVKTDQQQLTDPDWRRHVVNHQQVTQALTGTQWAQQAP
jgi:LPS sulfotransferase NodH